MPYVLPGDTRTRRLRGDFIRQKFPLPYSSLIEASPAPVLAARQISGLGWQRPAGMSGSYVPALWQEPPYRQGIGLDVSGAVDWMKRNPLIFAGVALLAVLALKGKRRR